MTRFARARFASVESRNQRYPIRGNFEDKRSGSGCATQTPVTAVAYWGNFQSMSWRNMLRPWGRMSRDATSAQLERLRRRRSVWETRPTYSEKKFSNKAEAVC